MSGFMFGSPGRVKAVLGPTNTGKTHLAMDRLLAHSSGIIGFPLRLLARENYDRMVARKGARHVALITGEEKILPPEARWFSCTVEAMPLDRRVEFLAVDEIQLCADPDRGHVFTERLLSARGMVETMFLGAETIRKLLKRLVPEAEIETRPRLSQLTYSGPIKLSRLPPRSAVVAFSAAEVYAIAELIRSRRGGCAVVMGRLSPRTRNAQVALYQDKEVDFLVATDAIGMGLNMDVDHVAFAGLSKFDGHRPRRLTAAETAQIAGRAGRGMRDGTFGVTANCPPLEAELVTAVESHAFQPIDQLFWRNAELDFASMDALLASLTAAPDRPGLIRGNEASDLTILSALSGDQAIRNAARTPKAVRLLWDACQIPDFRKLATDTHMRLCAKVFHHLHEEGRLPEDWVASQVAGLGRTDGDIDTLMHRLAEIRIWAYITARPEWVAGAVVWQGRAREAEDQLSDVLHEKLMARFVDRRAAKLTRRLEAGEDESLFSAVSARGEVLVEGHEVGRIEGFNFAPDQTAIGSDKRLVLRAARRALAAEMPRRVARLEAAGDEAFAIGDNARISWDGVAIAKLKPGASLLRPIVEVLPAEFLDGAKREAIRLRVQNFITAQVQTALAPLFQVLGADAAPDLRGLLHRLAEAGGILPGEAATPAHRASLRRLGIRAGRFALFIPALLKPRAAWMRALLWSVWHRTSMPELPEPGLVSIGRPDWPPAFAAFQGWVVAGTKAIRVDIAEMVAAELFHAARRHPIIMPEGLASRFGVANADLPAVLRALGLRLIPAQVLPDHVAGPPAPRRIAIGRQAPRTAPAQEPRKPVNPNHPFAALSSLRRLAS